jgi:hypothetical protein
VKAEKQFLVIGVKGRDGENWIDVLPIDPSKVINVNLIRGEFRGPIYDLPEWCVDNGFQCTIKTQAIGVEFSEVTTE